MGLPSIALLVLTILISQSSTESTLVVTNVIFRHGDRAPTGPLPIDRYNESFWPYGWGELTDIGKGQHYRLGKILRHRYDLLLRSKYWYKNIAVRSSDVDRCLISAYSNLAGIYSNSTESEDLELPFVNWQPVPVHSVPVVADDVLAMKRPCKKADLQSKLLFNSTAVRNINKAYKDFFSMVSVHTGLDLSKNGFKDVWQVGDNLFCEHAHQAPIPAWAQATNISCDDNSYIPCKGKTVYQVLREMGSLSFLVMYNSTTMHKFDGGPLLEDILTKFDQFVAGNRNISFNMYSGHDTTVAATLNALGVFDGKAPQYAATILIELHRNAANGYEVQVFYKNVTNDSAIHPMPLPGCASPCTLDNFNKLLEKYRIKDWDKACENNPVPSTTAHTPTGLTQEEIIVISVCSAIVLVLLVTACICYVRRKRISHNAFDYRSM